MFFPCRSALRLVWMSSFEELSWFSKAPPGILILIKIFAISFAKDLANEICSSIFFSRNVVFACPTCSPLPFLSHNTTRPLSWLLLPSSIFFIPALHRTLISCGKLFCCVSFCSFLSLPCQICFHLHLRRSLLPCSKEQRHTLFQRLLLSPLLCLMLSLFLKARLGSCKTVCSRSLTCLQGNTRQFTGTVVHARTKTGAHTLSNLSLLSLCSTDRLWNDY